MARGLLQASMKDLVGQAINLRTAQAEAGPLSPASLLAVMDGAGADATAKTQALTTAIAANSNLTQALAGSVVAHAQSSIATGSDAALAAAVSKTVAPILDNGIDVELSQPAMLTAGPRIIFAAVSLALAILCAGLMDQSSSKTSVYGVGLAVVGVGALLLSLVLVMGYGKVVETGGLYRGDAAP